MKQGNQQALFYHVREATVQSTDDVQTIEILLDGWIQKISVLCELGTVLNVAPTFVSILVTSKSHDDYISTNLTMRKPLSAHSTEDAMAIHGLPDMIPFVFFFSQDDDANTMVDLELYIASRITSGHSLKVLVNMTDFDGNNTAGDVITQIEIKQVVSPRKFQ